MEYGGAEVQPPNTQLGSSTLDADGDFTERLPIPTFIPPIQKQRSSLSGRAPCYTVLSTPPEYPAGWAAMHRSHQTIRT